MDPYLRHREGVAEKLSGSQGITRRGRKAWLSLGIGFVLLLGFWFFMFVFMWILGSATGIDGYLITVSSSGSTQQSGTVVVRRGSSPVSTVNATKDEGFSIDLEPGEYVVEGSLNDGRTCYSRTVVVPDRGFTDVNLICGGS
jgi:hypothetical protein